MTTRRSTQKLTALGAAALVGSLALGGCSAQAEPAATAAGVPAATAAPASTTESASDSARVALVREYLSAVASGDTEASWALLSPESQAFYGTVDTYKSIHDTNGTVTATEAAALSAAPLVETEGTEGAFTLVSAATSEHADAWIVREGDAGLRIDDAGIPPTGPSLYWWNNPAAGPEDQTGPAPYDPASPVRISFAVADPANGPSLVGSPTVIDVWQGNQRIDATLESASDAERTFVMNTTPDAQPHAVTVVWKVSHDSHEWRSSTVLLTS
jgi:hypothetical protein